MRASRRNLEEPRGLHALVRARLGVWYSSLIFHSVILVCLGFFTIAQKTGLARVLGSPGLRPNASVRLRPAELSRIDLDHTPRAVGETPSIAGGIAPPEQGTVADHDESADGEDYAQARSEVSLAHLAPGTGWGGSQEGAPGVTATATGAAAGPGSPRFGVLGKGAGGGQGRGGRRGGRQNLVVRGGGSESTERAVEAGLHWLARHQSADGSWGAPWKSDCVAPGKCPTLVNAVAVAGVAVAAFLDAGYTPRSRTAWKDPVSGSTVRVGAVVDKALRFLLGRQKADGSFDTSEDDLIVEGVYPDAMATHALAEAAARCPTPEITAAARRAVGYLEATHHPGALWGVTLREDSDEVGVSGWSVLALRSAERAGLTVDREIWKDVASFCASLTDDEGYCQRNQGDAERNGRRQFTSTAQSALARLHSGRLSATDRGKAVVLLGQRLPERSGWLQHIAEDRRAPREGDVSELTPRHVAGTDFMSGAVDLDYVFHGTVAMFALDHDGPSWRAWNASLVKALLSTQHQRNEGCLGGSWGDGAFSTSLACLSLEIYYREAPTSLLGPR